MHNWQSDLLSLAENQANATLLFARLREAAKLLGFDYCAYGFRAALPLSRPKISLLNNYPEDWTRAYLERSFELTDPTVLHGRKSQTPLLWSDAVFAPAPELWSTAQSMGLRHGWSKSCLDSMGVGGMLSLARSHEPLSAAELQAKSHKMAWLAHLAHLTLVRTMGKEDVHRRDPRLTHREIEMLQWSADGKSSQDIADILCLSKNTVDFHVKNAVKKLQTTNKTAAVVRAAMMGLLN